MDKRICKSCKLIKDYIQDGSYPSAKNKRFKDGAGGVWSGRTCPACNNLRLKTHMANKRLEKSNE